MAKKRANGEGSIRKREDGKGWEARYYDEKGKRHSLYGKTQGEVRKKLVATFIEKKADSETEECDLTIAQWLEIWQHDFIGNVKPGTAVSYEMLARVHIVPTLGEIKLTALRTPVCSDCIIKNLHRGLARSP